METKTTTKNPRPMHRRKEQDSLTDDPFIDDSSFYYNYKIHNEKPWWPTPAPQKKLPSPMLTETERQQIP